MRYLQANAQHRGARAYQQDSFGIADPTDEAFVGHGGFLAVLCDGMGGMAHGDIASQTAVQTILEAYARKTPEESIPEALERSIREANQCVLGAAEELGKADGVGTTVVATVLHSESLYFASVGDSGLFHLSGGQMHMVNRPHVFANMLEQAVAAGTISREQAERHPERESLTSFVGIQTLQDIDRNTEPWPVRAGETILLASDGMFKTLEPHEILETLVGPPQGWPQALVDRVLEKQQAGQDNVTVLSVTLVDENDWAENDWPKRDLPTTDWAKTDWPKNDAPELSHATPAAVPSVFNSPPAEAGLDHFANPFPNLGEEVHAKGPKSFLLIALSLLIVAVAFGSIWYFYWMRR